MTSEREEMITKYLWDNFKAIRVVGRSDQFDHDPRFTWECPAYLEAAGKHRCRDAVDIDGTPCCRVCWTHPDEVVNYTLHA